MGFKQLNDKIKANFDLMQQGKLFLVDLSGIDVSKTYLESFKPEDDPIWRDPNSSTHNCRNDLRFLERYAGIVSLDADLNLHSIFDIEIEESSKYYEPIRALSRLVKSRPIQSVFKESYEYLNSTNYGKVSTKNPTQRIGNEYTKVMYTEKNPDPFGVIPVGEVHTYHHFHLDLSNNHIVDYANTINNINTDYQLIQKSLGISLGTIDTILDWIDEDILFNGKAHREKLVELRNIIKNKKDHQNYVWTVETKYPRVINELIGTVLQEIEKGKDLDQVVLDYNKRVDPVNYMKSKKAITKGQKDQAQKFIEENGYIESFDRTQVKLEDISPEEILHINNAQKKISIFDKIEVSNDKVDIDVEKLPQISIQEFMDKVLPNSKSLEVLFDNHHENNLVTLTRPVDSSSKPIFKWSNNYSWTFNGNMSTTSNLIDVVKSKGGKVDGFMNFMLGWNESGTDNSDLDLHCILPNSHRIYFSRPNNRDYNAMLDIDIRDPGGKFAVENITFNEKEFVSKGTYQMVIDNFYNRNSQGFVAEIRIGTDIYSYQYKKPLQHKEDVTVAEVTFKADGSYTIKHHLDCNNAPKEIWGIKTKQFHPVKLMCLSPNYWGENKVGNKHFMFFIDGCKPDGKICTFHNDNLNSDLVPHRKVTDVLAQITKIEPEDKGLSGIGFNETLRNNVVVRVDKNKVFNINI